VNHEAVVVDHSDVAGSQPPIDDRLGGEFRLIPVATHQHGAACRDFAVLCQAEFDARQR
jgi:hypothetical protein